MKINALGKDRKLAGKILQLSDHHEPDMEIDAKSSWILSIIGALSFGGIWLVSELIK
jgi:hypothetical protein